MPNVPRPDAPNAYVPRPVGTENRELAEKLNGGLSLGAGKHLQRTGNIDGQWLWVKFPSVANTEYQIRHGLGRVPFGYIPARKDFAASIYDSSVGSWTNNVMYLKCDVKSITALLWVF